MFKTVYNQTSDMPVSIIIFTAMLTILGLISLFSIRMNQFGEVGITAFTKQLLFLIPSFVGFITILLNPK